MRKRRRLKCNVISGSTVTGADRVPALDDKRRSTAPLGHYPMNDGAVIETARCKFNKVARGVRCHVRAHGKSHHPSAGVKQHIHINRHTKTRTRRGIFLAPGLLRFHVRCIGRIEQLIAPSDDAREFRLAIRPDILNGANGRSPKERHHHKRRVGGHAGDNGLHTHCAGNIAEGGQQRRQVQLTSRRRRAREHAPVRIHHDQFARRRCTSANLPGWPRKCGVWQRFKLQCEHSHKR